MTGGEWLMKLIVTACLLGGFPHPDKSPEVTMLHQNDLAVLVCGGACPVHGAYVSWRGIMLSDTLDFDESPIDRSILLHEVVHYLQDINGMFADEEPCDRYRLRELQAYDIQDRYLTRYGRGLGNVAASLEWIPLNCQNRRVPDGQADRPTDDR